MKTRYMIDKPYTGPRQYKVNSKRNSECSVSLENLDWNNWWTDGMWLKPPAIYLHVKHKNIKGMGDTIHRVSCKPAKNKKQVRLKVVNGELYWLVDEK